MKKTIFCLLLLLAAALHGGAQNTLGTAQGMGYQALLRGVDGVPLAEEPGVLTIEVLSALDSVLFAQDLDVVTDGYGMLFLTVGGGVEWAALPWHEALQMRATWTGSAGSVSLGTQVMSETPKSRYSGNGWFFQGPEDLRLALESDTVRLHADSLIVIGNTREGDTLLTEVVRLQAQRDVILSGRDDIAPVSAVKAGAVAAPHSGTNDMWHGG